MLFHLGDGELGDVEEAVEVHRQHIGVVFCGVRGEWLGNEDAGVVDQGIDAAETGDRFTDHALGGFRFADVAGHGENVRIGGRLDRPRGGDDLVTEFAESLDHAIAQALGCAGDHNNFFRMAHD
ncbi:hypothetical protein D3C84_662850 [compost metagenome]